MPNRIFLAVVFFAISLLLNAQSNDFRPVRARDFSKTPLSNEQDYDALVLFRKHYSYFSSNHQDFSNNTIVHERILINNDDGLRYATQMISLYKGEKDSDKVTDITGTTYNLVNNEIITTELDESSIFYEKRNDHRNRVKFTMPAAGKGSIIDFYYKIVSPFIYIRDIPIQYDIPIDHLDLDVRLSRSIVYNVAFNPEAFYKLGFSEEIKDDFLKNLKDFEPPSTEKNELLDLSSILTAKNRTVSVKTGAIPSYKNEKGSGGKNRYRAKLMFEVAATGDGYGRYKYYASDWEAVSSSIMKSQYFGAHLNSSGFFKSDLKTAVDDNLEEREKALAVFRFLTNRVKWNGNAGKFIDEGAKAAYQKGSGNAAELNLLLVNMLRESGLDAYPVLTGTQYADTPVFPTRDGFNYVITQVKIGSEDFLLDATEPLATFNVLPERIAQWKGRVIMSEKKSKWINLERKIPSKVKDVIKIDFNQDLSANFSTERSLTHFAAYQTRKELTSADEQSIKNNLLVKVTGVEVKDYEITNLNSTEVPLNVNINGVLKGGWDLINDNFYIVPLSYLAMTSNPYSDNIRKQPFFLPYPIDQTKEVNLKVPEDYHLKSLPEPLQISFNDDEGTYTYSIFEEDGFIKTKSELKLLFSKILPENYQEFKSFMNTIRDKEADRVIFTKKP
ncbi:MAG: DUF3858 domain-containing protein [Nonlabens sp.]